MPYAIRKDGLGWRSIDEEQDCAEDENYTEIKPDPVAPLKTQFTSLEFLDRFTEAEQLSVVEATMVSAPVKLWYDRLLAASFIDLLDPRTAEGIDALIAAGLIEADRKSELLTP